MTTINKVLSKKHRMFIEAFNGDVVEAMTIAGFSGQESYLRMKGTELLADPNIVAALKERSKYLNKMGNVIASRDERQMFWTSIMNNNDPHHIKDKDPLTKHELPAGNIPMNVRLKASEMLGKAEGDFVERIDISGKLTISEIIQQSYKIEDKSIEDIEAEYIVMREQKKKADAEEETIEEIEYKEIPQSQSLGDLI